MTSPLAEMQRMDAHRRQTANWKKWGPYLSERAWGSVREDYSRDGNPWNYFPHDHARSRVYRWNEDGLAGISDRNQYICFALTFWNEKDPILKERLFGLAGNEGNHAEDVKEYYFYLDNTPTHSYMKMLYKYPLNEFPYDKLLTVNRQRTCLEPEYELLDTGIFDDDHYLDVFVEYAKQDQEDLLISVTVHNRSQKEGRYHFLPTIWFRNTWSWGYENGPMDDVLGKPCLWKIPGPAGVSTIELEHSAADNYYFYADLQPALLFTDNETNYERLYQSPNNSTYVKDAFHRYVINQEQAAVNPEELGTKAAAHYVQTIPPQGMQRFKLRLSKLAQESPFAQFDEIIAQRQKEADEYYESLRNPILSQEETLVQRQGMAGLLWSKQLYYFDLEEWEKGDPNDPMPPGYRLNPRNKGWEHLVNFDVLSMPDTWEYPWYASWDLAFQSIALVHVDPEFAKRQLELMTREWYMHPNGQLPAYEWNFSDVNPPVHAWACWRVYKIDAKESGRADRSFLQGMFNKLLLNFTWWINRKDAEGRNLFQGGFLGMDNISVFDRSAPLPTGGHIDQSDGTAWMGFYCIVMMKIALELAKEEATYQDMASKFFEHFLRISSAMTCTATEHSLWNAEDGFFYDNLKLPSGQEVPLKVRSLVGLLPLFAVETIDSETLRTMPIFSRRMDWFVSKWPELSANLACVYRPGMSERRLLSIVTETKLRSLLHYMLDEQEFLSEYGIRSLSKYHEKHPYTYNVNGCSFAINYQPAESQSGLFGGNSNWRGPLWFPINFLLIESLQKYHHYFGDDFTVDFPTGSGKKHTLWEVARELSRRLSRLFLPNQEGKRPIYAHQKKFQDDPHWKDLILFYEYFNGDTGEGLGASHQTGWTGLVVKLIQQSGGKI